MPVLARLVEAAGIATVTVTMMPDIASAMRTPRIVGVEFPFGHAFGMPHDRETQRTVLAAALDLIDTADEPGARVDLDLAWPQDDRTAYRDWQPPVPSPVVQLFIDRLRAARAAE